VIGRSTFLQPHFSHPAPQHSRALPSAQATVKMVSLPKFQSTRNRRNAAQHSEKALSQNQNGTVLDNSSRPPSGDTLTPSNEVHLEGGTHDISTIKRATHARKVAIGISTFCFFVSVVFLILVLIGNIKKNNTLNKIWFLKLDLSHIIPINVPNATLLNSIAQTLGLHDFYTVGVWGFCEGYNSSGVQRCSKPADMYWFDPVTIILNELFSGATIALPSDINHILSIIKIASHFMFACFIVGIVFCALSFLIVFTTIYSRWVSFLMGFVTFIAAFFTTVGSVIATVMFLIFKNTFEGTDEVNIKATLGTEMFIFMWIASGFSLVGLIMNLGMCCCCASRRDLKRGTKKGKKAFEKHQEKGTNGVQGAQSAGTRRRWGFGRGKRVDTI
jgi:SUR7/PalI family